MGWGVDYYQNKLYFNQSGHFSKMTENFQVENSHFSCDLSLSLSSLLASSSLCDVTLICEDGHLAAHKVILAATSTFFSSVFHLNYHNHPLIYLRGIKTVQMKAVLDYIYSGATQVIEEDLANFLAVAEDLKIDGLMKSNQKASKKLKGKIKRKDIDDEIQEKTNIFKENNASDDMENDYETSQFSL